MGTCGEGAILKMIPGHTPVAGWVLTGEASTPSLFPLVSCSARRPCVAAPGDVTWSRTGLRPARSPPRCCTRLPSSFTIPSSRDFLGLGDHSLSTTGLSVGLQMEVPQLLEPSSPHPTTAPLGQGSGGEKSAKGMGRTPPPFPLSL